MPRILSTVALALFVLAAQFGALPHEISHGIWSGYVRAPAATASGTAPSKAAAAKPASSEKGANCDKCFQFANVNGAGFSITPAFALLRAFADAASVTQPAELPGETPQPRGRGPPVFL